MENVFIVLFLRLDSLTVLSALDPVSHVCICFPGLERMDDGTYNLFKRVAQKMGWAGEGRLDEAEAEVCISVEKYLA